MELNQMDAGTLAAVKVAVTRDHKDGTMLCDDAESTFFFTTEIATGHWYYVELKTEPIIQISTGVMQRPTNYMRRMIRANYAGLRIHRDRRYLAGDVGEIVDDLDAEELSAHEAEMLVHWHRDEHSETS